MERVFTSVESILFGLLIQSNVVAVVELGGLFAVVVVVVVVVEAFGGIFDFFIEETSDFFLVVVAFSFVPVESSVATILYT